MKFTCTKENLAQALDVVSGVAARQVNLPILNNILFQAQESKVRLTATNLEISVRVNLRAKVDKTGAFTAPAKTLTDFIHLLPDEQVDIELQENELSIKCGSSSTKIKGAPADEYPVVPEAEEAHAYVLAVKDFKQALGQTAVAAAKNEIRPELAGVHFGFFIGDDKGLALAATDSYRLAEKKIKVEQGEDEIKAIVPARAAQEMGRLLSIADSSENQVRLWLSENQIALRYNDFEFTSRLIEGKYPDYTQIIPHSFKTTAVFPSALMINKIKAAGLFTTTGVNAVSLDFNTTENTISVSSTSTQTGEHSSKLETEVAGEENSILLNHRYVLDGLQHLDSEEVEFKMNSGDSPCLFKAKGRDDYIYIVMPIRQ